MGRYTIGNDWDEHERRQIENVAGAVIAMVITETATLVDTRGGHSYTDGAYRVRIVYRDVDGMQWPADKPRTKTFKGESAWSYAASYVRDSVAKIRKLEDRMWI